MIIEQARELAAQAWCTKENEGKDIDVELCNAFAEIIMKAYLKGTQDGQKVNQ